MTTTKSEELKEQAQRVVKEKDEIEAQLRELDEVLRAQNVGLDEPLVDAEGFPRADIDVYAVRAARANIIRLNNDLKAKMVEVEQALHAYHTEARLERSTESQVAGSVAKKELRPFATVSAVSPDSPACAAGLQRGDQILMFGNIRSDNHDHLRALTPLVSQSEGVRGDEFEKPF